MSLAKATPVSWQIDGAPYRGEGLTIADEDSNGQVLVAVTHLGLVHDDVPMSYHPVIWCNATWLKNETPLNTNIPLSQFGSTAKPIEDGNSETGQAALPVSNPSTQKPIIVPVSNQTLGRQLGSTIPATNQVFTGEPTYSTNSVNPNVVPTLTPTVAIS